MKIIEKEIKIKDKNLIAQKSLLFDIETTGFSRTSARIYLIGSLAKENNKYIFRQYLTENSADEKLILKEFLNLALSYDYLVSFNGDSFDLPFIKARCQRYGLDSSHLDAIESIDLYKLIKEKALFVSLDNYKLKTIEKFMGLNREDLFTGGELISLYYEYENGDKNLENILLLHNEEDIINMPIVYEFLDFLDRENTIKLGDVNFLIEKISLKKNKLEITGRTSIDKAFLQGSAFKLSVEDKNFIFEHLVQEGLYKENSTCSYVEKHDLDLVCNYKIASPEEIYLLKVDKKQLNLNIKTFFHKVLAGLME
ncbi:MAG: ribonuclease H-like domain-containing protein [Bacillota bacterium]|nr:ribonuclease H-like domain-containing protein [Bacillota bacterium]